MKKSSKPAVTTAEAQELVGKLIKRGVLEFKPTIDKEGVHYVEIEKNLEDADSADVKKMLENLEKQGVVKSKVTDRVLTCPDCGSPEVYSKYVCPKCGSYNVEYTELLEHMKCGYIGPRNKFVKNSSLVCPSCQTVLEEGGTEHRIGKEDKQVELKVYSGVKYLTIGSCYECEKCGYRFDKPEIVHLCQKCGRTFAYPEAKYVKVFSYDVTDETVKDFGRDLPILGNIKKILTERGFKVQLHPRIAGASGVRHPFDILAERNGTRLVIDVSLTGNKNDIISLLGKKVDVNPTKALMIDLSKSDKLAPFGKIYEIEVFKTTKDHSIPTDFEKFLATLDSARTPKTSETITA